MHWRRGGADWIAGDCCAPSHGKPLAGGAGSVASEANRRCGVCVPRSAWRQMILWDGQGFCLYYKVLERGRFPWPARGDGAVRLASVRSSVYR
uniref:IS66 family insertion sequence element accessory protein TnpB n=1 Tax=Paracoccus mutanolyticus TaxID=1499308 RepID=UPI00294FFBCC|nr:IS66 family insertion sequence element accessory protein TnpB [Paracoccus mutanolyticus]